MDPKQTSINYIYFGGLFALLVFITAGGMYTKENLGGSQFFFFLYALGQIVLEILFFIFMGILIRRYLGKIGFALFIGMTFTALILHLLDFILDRIIDLSAWESLKIFVFEESLENFFYLLDASGISLWGWFLIFAVLGSVPLIGMFLYKITDIVAQKRPFAVRHGLFFQAFLCIPCALLFWDFSASKVIHPDAYTAFIKSLPWKVTFLHPQNVLYSLPAPLSQLPTEKAIADAIEQNNFLPIKKPNIYLFIAESLREDCITAEIAPNLTHFKNSNSHFDTALSNGNATHISWFSIFFSQFPYCWNKVQKHWKMGSPALKLLKKYGYQIHLYSSAQLGYYGMDKLIFGDLPETTQTFHHAPPLQAADSDAAALNKLQKDIAENPALQQGQIFIIFWDCTHFAYSWPKNWSPKFTPFSQEFAYFKAFHSDKTIGHIKNGYKNSVNYMDSLFGSFLTNLPNSEEAIIIFTGDHGEEFFDHGHLFHNSHLTHEQIHVPLYFKFPNRPISSQQLVSQMDIFPTLFDYLTNNVPSFLEGNSLFQQPHWPFAITARFNAGLAPYEFSIHNGKNKLIAQFLNRSDIFDSDRLQILSLRTCNDKRVSNIKNNTGSWIDEEFAPAISRLFPEND